MSILVTGGAGFIGSNFVRILLENEAENTKIINYDLLTYSGRLENIEDLRSNKRHIFINGDIRDAKHVDRVIKKYNIKTIFNFAAETHVDRSLVLGDSFISTDVNGTFVLLESARINKVDNFIQVSTDEVYGSADNNSRKFKESDALHPSSPYSASKAAADLLTLSFHTSYDMNVKITRSSNNYGPYQYPEKFIPKLIIRSIMKKKIPVYGQGQQRRNWIHVFDNCYAILTVFRKGKNGKTYNVSTGDEYSNIDVAKTVLKNLALPDSMIKFVEDRPGHDARYAIDSTQIQSLNWRPRYRLKESLPSIIDWYRNNKWWWRPMINDKFVKSDTPWK